MSFKPFEQKLHAKGYQRVAGIDEAGRGPLAGPVAAAAVVLGNDIPEGLNDSKKISESRREELFEALTNSDCDFGVGFVDQFEIDRINILQATVLAMKRAIGALKHPPEYLLVDGKYLPDFIYPASAITQGDAKCQSIAAASIIAKVSRDRIMKQIHTFFPDYGFAKHKGYGTKQHLDAILRHGPTPIHRLTFGGVREHLPKLRSQRKALGKWGEDYACLHLWQKGATMVHRNFHASNDAELDIVVMLNGSLRFIEVKTGYTRDFSNPEEWVDSKKQEKIYQASEYFLYKHKNFQDIPCQFDLAAIEVNNGKTKVRYYENAFGY